jgi:hypothetical protein
MDINPLYHLTPPLKGETAADYWNRMYSVADSKAQIILEENWFKPTDYRSLIAHINSYYGKWIAPDKEGKQLITCPATQSGAVCLERHIQRGGFNVVTGSQPPKTKWTEPIETDVFPMPPTFSGIPAQPIQPAAAATQPDTAALSAALAALSALMPKQGVDEDAVRRIVAEVIGAGGFYRGIELTIPDMPTRTLEGQFHRKFPDLLKALSMRQSVYLYGPAGTSKTSSAMAAAKALGLPFVLEVVGLTSTKTDFLGFVDAGGKCTETNFKRAFLNGGVYFIDEADSANANVGIALNTAIENGICAFPDGVFTAHPDFVAVAAGNTNGKGGTAQFGGRVRMDSAFQDRFAFMNWPIDEEFERNITSNRDWTAKVQRIRSAVAELGLDELAVTPRLSIKGERMLAAGFSESDVLDMLLFRGAVSEDVKYQILSRI